MSRHTPIAVAVTLLFLPGTVVADPCGMVPPISVGNDVQITRVGLQKTYVFFRDGIETLVIRPGFEGRVEEFGMLIPMPEVPALRKVSDNVFPHIAAAVDPPEVVVNLVPLPLAAAPGGGGFGGGGGAWDDAKGLKLGRDEVRVAKEEAVGMYEVAVLRAGSAEALNTWMDDHGYKYPEGMDAACEDYVREGWCFVAVKTKVGAKGNVDPKPGQRATNPDLPGGSTFDGHVQAMGFRFRTRTPVIPMRLSTFNEGDLRNVVYILTTGPSGLVSIPREYVVRQVSGEELIRNVTGPLPLRVLGGDASQIPEQRRPSLAVQRDPEPHNGVAKDLFASDLLAVAEGRLVHPHEETEKMLLRIGERLDLRGPEIDSLNATALEAERDATVERGLAMLRGMTLSIVDGDFPRAILANQNLRLSRYQMARRMNTPARYDALEFGPNRDRSEGTLFRGELSAVEPANPVENVAWVESADPNPASIAWVGLVSAVLIGSVLTFRRRTR